MNFFGVSPLEILFVAILGLIIFGPERLPEIGRFLGRSVARVLAWQYNSPEAQMLNELRRDFEKQIVEIRDEMVYARQQLDVRSELTDLQRETEALIRGELSPKKAISELKEIQQETEALIASQPSASAAANATTAAPVATATEPTIAPPIGTGNPPPVTVPAPPAIAQATNGVVPSSEADHLQNQNALSSDIAALTQQIERLSADLQNLQQQLHQRGVLDPTWQPINDEVQQEQIA